MYKIGAWLVGICGNVGTTVVTGAKAIEKNLISTTGLTTEMKPFRPLSLIRIEDIMFGGHDLRNISLYEMALCLCKDSKIFDTELLSKLKKDLLSVDKEVKPGITIDACEKQVLRKVIKSIQKDIRSFQKRNNLKEVIVVNLASTEPRINEDISIEEFEEALDKNIISKVSTSSMYAYAAIHSGFPYINFTPSSGSSIPALIELAEKKGSLHMGRDGKTGETLVKSVLAPLFKFRNLEVLGWEGYNLLGNRDGETLMETDKKASKIKTKDSVLPGILGYSPHTHVGIDFVPSLDDWKTAWDFIHFKGFMDTKMSMQFIWQGCDSILAAPLVIDLIRLAEFSKRRNEKGIMKQLSCFFKDPLCVEKHDLQKQMELLFGYIRKYNRGKRRKK